MVVVDVLYAELQPFDYPFDGLCRCLARSMLHPVSLICHTLSTFAIDKINIKFPLDIYSIF
jgi:hypothetical protein